MKFKINNTEWTIEEVDEATINNEMKDNDTLGATFFRRHEIWLANNNVDMIRTLKHELMHAWLWEYGHNQHEKEFNSEDICEIVASSNDFINEVVDEYKKIKIEVNGLPNLSARDLERLAKKPTQILNHQG